MFRILRKALGAMLMLGALFCLLQVSAIDSWSEHFLLGIGFVVLTVGLAVAAGYLLGTIGSNEQAVPEFVPSEFVPENELEISLVEAAIDTSRQAQFFDVLRTSRLYTLLAESGETPMTISMRFDGAIDPSAGQEEFNYGPWLWCFTSAKRVEQFLTATPLGEFFERTGVGQFDVPYLCRFALENNAPIVLNPNLGCEMNLAEEDVRKLSD
ncbi:MAG: hypothetical protein IID44_21125 [Planctomycetes bacterium]|nr:hypothetical protein [Planctomycetota bacterium]